jgi:fatty acid desaturase
MDILMLLVALALMATIFSLLAGVSSMTVGHDVGHRSSAQWMNLRVAFQSVAIVLILLALLNSH